MRAFLLVFPEELCVVKRVLNRIGRARLTAQVMLLRMMHSISNRIACLPFWHGQCNIIIPIIFECAGFIFVYYTEGSTDRNDIRDKRERHSHGNYREESLYIVRT